jgi:hypothetical protein
MNSAAPDWDALRAVFASPAQGAQAGAGQVVPLQLAQRPINAPIGPDMPLAQDLAEERAAILEYDAGLPRQEAEARAGKAHGVRVTRGRR